MLVSGPSATIVSGPSARAARNAQCVHKQQQGKAVVRIDARPVAARRVRVYQIRDAAVGGPPSSMSRVSLDCSPVRKRRTGSASVKRNTISRGRPL